MSDDGRAVVRVTSQEPVQVAALNFLIEVDWGQGRLVREYSALVDTPGALAAASEPIIEAPLPPPSNTIIREPEAAVASEPAPGSGGKLPLRVAPHRACCPVAAAPAVATPAPTVPAAANGQVEVQRGQTLSQIARELGQGYSLDQTMLALLRANPEAFINGNINRLKQGAVLRVPQSAEQARLGRVRSGRAGPRPDGRMAPGAPADSATGRIDGDQRRLRHVRRPRPRRSPRRGSRSHRPPPVRRPGREHNPASMPKARVTCWRTNN